MKLEKIKKLLMILKIILILSEELEVKVQQV
jgi:hypothetical protein